MRIESVGDSSPPYDLAASEGFAAWLHASNAALAVTTYQIGKLFLIGAPAPDRLSVTERTFERCLGVSADGSALTLAGLNAIYRFRNVVPPGQSLEGHDAVFVPQVAWYTGDVFAHDVGVLASGRPLFINTLFSCVATVDESSSFCPVWNPPFVSMLAPQDRCHLNGLAMDGYTPRYVSAAGRGDSAQSWREARIRGGCVVDIASNSIVVDGLTMPHSPRLSKGRLYLCNAGTGELGEVEVNSGRFVPLAFCPGFLRGLAFHAGYALVGLSLPRRHRDFSGLPLDDRLKQKNRNPDCAIEVLDLETGRLAHWLRLGGVVQELYDIAIIPGVRSPMVVGFAQGQINRLITRGRTIPLDSILGEPRSV
jgi:uncharacterized protein (TIGR03032 family)